MMTLGQKIRRCIEQKLDEGFKQFIIYPLGDTGMQVKEILNTMYGIQESYIIDNHRSKYNSRIKNLAFLDSINCVDYCLLLSCTNPKIYEELKADASRYFPEQNIAELIQMTAYDCYEAKYKPKIGKYSYGPLCEGGEVSLFIEEIGAFCSFAVGTAVLGNHETRYLTTHCTIDAGGTEIPFREYTEYKNRPWYFEGIKPRREMVAQFKRIKIGNDVWLGRNVVITNYANIGNGVIAAAGAVITKDVPDYAVVAGVPARIIRYRYTPEQISALNKIAWWDWSDDDIRARFDDFYLPIDEFIRKYL